MSNGTRPQSGHPPGIPAPGPSRPCGPGQNAIGAAAPGLGQPGPAARRHTMGKVAAYAAAAVAFGYALVSLYWAAGGHALASTVGGYVAQFARRGGPTPVLVALAAAMAKVAGGLLALALVRPWGLAIRRRWLLAGSAIASVLLAAYGVANVLAGALVLSGVIHPAGRVDRAALAWHAGLWDLWFLVWGILLALATAGHWRGRPAERVMRLIDFATTVGIDRPARDVWALLADYGRDPEWRAGVVSMTADPPGRAVPGTTTAEVMRFAGRTLRNDGTIICVGPGYQLAWRTTSGIDATGVRVVEPRGPHRCRVRLATHVQPHGFDRLLAPLAHLLLQRRISRDGRRLRSLANGPAPPKYEHHTPTMARYSLPDTRATRSAAHEVTSRPTAQARLPGPDETACRQAPRAG